MGRTCGTYGETGNTYRILVLKLTDRENLEEPEVDVTIILKWMCS
jgi:hypothetical protein